MHESTLLLWLEGPLQSWGADSLFNRRASLDFPTRSGVLGLILAAMGAGGEQSELLARFKSLPQTVIAYARRNISPAAARLQMTDFHMVGSGYDAGDAWQKLHIPKTSEGKPAVGGGAKLTYRDYVQDAAFAVIMAVPPDLADQVVEALQCPCWDSSLGRRCCVPTEFIYQGRFPDEAEAGKKAVTLAEDKDRREIFRVCDGENEAGELFVLPDVPLRFGTYKEYAERRVTLLMHPATLGG